MSEWVRIGMGTYLKWGTHVSQRDIPIHRQALVTLLAPLSSSRFFTFGTLIHKVYFFTTSLFLWDLEHLLRSRSFQKRRLGKGEFAEYWKGVVCVFVFLQLAKPQQLFSKNFTRNIHMGRKSTGKKRQMKELCTAEWEFCTCTLLKLENMLLI